MNEKASKNVFFAILKMLIEKKYLAKPESMSI